jgi:hypothetical protein
MYKMDVNNKKAIQWIQKMTNLALADPAWRLVSESAPTEVPPFRSKLTD